jgi:hypothetical protein
MAALSDVFDLNIRHCIPRRLLASARADSKPDAVVMPNS